MREAFGDENKARQDRPTHAEPQAESGHDNMAKAGLACRVEQIQRLVKSQGSRRHWETSNVVGCDWRIYTDMPGSASGWWVTSLSESSSRHLDA